MEAFPYNLSANADYSLLNIYNQSLLQTNSPFLHAYISPFQNNLNTSNGVNSSVPKPFLGDAKLPIKLQDLNGLFSDSYAAHVLNQSRDLPYIAKPCNSGMDVKPKFVALSKPNHDHDYMSSVERGSSVSHQKTIPSLNAVARSRKRKALYKSKEEHEGCVYPKGSVKQKNTIESQSFKDFIHVRARRGQATDSHSLAERVRREKINERMKILKDLIPGCTKTMGKALMLEEIINYVKSLQNQIELLSMKLAAVSPSYDFSAGINTELAIESSMAHKIGTRPSSSIEVSQGSHTLGFPTATGQFIEEKPWPLTKGAPNQWDGDLQYFLGQHDLWDADLQRCMKNEYQPVLES